MQRRPAIVIGCGQLGSAALYRRPRPLGPGMLGIEQFPFGHEQGGSGDRSRIIRLVQHQRPYAALAFAAYRSWRRVGRASGQCLVTTTGGLVVEDAAHRALTDTDARSLKGYAAMLTRFDVGYEPLDAGEVTRRWPQFRLTQAEQPPYQKDTLIPPGRTPCTCRSLAPTARRSPRTPLCGV